MNYLTSLRAPEPRRQGINRLTVPTLLVWLGLLGVGFGGALVMYQHAFPLAPHQAWETTRDEAVAIVSERLYDLGELPAGAYITATLRFNVMVELHLLAERQAVVGASGADGRGLDDSGSDETPAATLSRRVSAWLVTVYRPGASLSEWAFRGQVALNGELQTLLQGVAPGFTSPVQLTLEDATSRADIFLRDAGFELGDFYSPVERRVEMAEFSYQLLRYQYREAVSEKVDGTIPGNSNGGVEHGLEVRFAGSDLLGFRAYEDQVSTERFEQRVQGISQVQFAQFLVIFLLLPLVSVVFVRRYHLGVVGARRGAQIFAVILGCSLVVVVFTARSASEGMDFGGFTRSNVTLGWVGLLLFIYLPALALLGGASAAVGESLAHGTWRSRWAVLDAVLRGQWANGTVARSALRGVASGCLLVTLLQGGAVVLARQEVFSPFGFLLGPWWSAAALPGVMLVLVEIAFTTASLSFALLFLVPMLAARLGVFLAGSVAALVMTGLFFAPVATVPVLAGLPLVLLFSACVVLLFFRYGFFTAWLANFVAVVAPGAFTLMAASDVDLRVQGAGVLVVAAAPLWFSLRHVLGSKHYRYEYDDVPPHVRLIADRERQRVELETARGIQASILPDLPPSLAGVEVATTYVPASEVGGDFFDAIVLEDGRLAVAIGDVAGHGVASGLIMSMVRSALAVQVRFRPEVEDVVTALNRVVFESARRRLLTTLCYALYDPKSRRLNYASAGHLYPYRISPDGEIEVLESTAYPLGVRRSLELECRTAQLSSGDAVFLSSDGLVEARRHGGEEVFGFERLQASLRRHAGADAEGIREGVLEDLQHFVASGNSWSPATLAPDDDLTLLVLRVP